MGNSTGKKTDRSGGTANLGPVTFDPARPIQARVTGDGGVGKSSLVIRFATDNWVEEYDPTIEDSYRKQLMVDEQPVMIEILDEAGPEEFSAMRDQWTRQYGALTICCFAINDRSSFEQVRTEYERTCRVRDTDAPCFIVVGTKCDLESERQVTTTEATALVGELRTPLYLETSAKENINVKRLFEEAVRAYSRSEHAHHTYGAREVRKKK